MSESYLFRYRYGLDERYFPFPVCCEHRLTRWLQVRDLVTSFFAGRWVSCCLLCVYRGYGM